MPDNRLPLDELRWGDLYRLVDLAREASIEPHTDVQVTLDDNGLPVPLGHQAVDATVSELRPTTPGGA